MNKVTQLCLCVWYITLSFLSYFRPRGLTECTLLAICSYALDFCVRVVLLRYLYLNNSEPEVTKGSGITIRIQVNCQCMYSFPRHVQNRPETLSRIKTSQV